MSAFTSTSTSSSTSDERKDPIEEAVRQIWLEQPGIGIKELMEAVKALLSPLANDCQHPTLTKKRVKAAKSALRYRRLANAPDAPPNFDQEKFVQQQLELRSDHRAGRRFEPADHISRGLTAMGIIIDDAYKTWQLGPPTVPATLTGGNNCDQPDIALQLKGVPCQMCGRFFGSRNLVFKHLRDPASGCGTSLYASGQSIAEPPSVVEKKLKQQQEEIKHHGRRSGATARHAPKDACLWMGDLPLKWTRAGGRHRNMRALLYAHTPRGVPRPWIKTVVRKAYRSGRRPACAGDDCWATDDMPEEHAEQQEVEQQEKQKDGGEEQQQERHPLGDYLGYAIVVYRDAAEAAFVMNEMDGMEVSAKTVFGSNVPHTMRGKSKDLADLLKYPPFSLRVRNAFYGDTSAAASLHTENHDDCGKQKNMTKSSLPPGLDPMLSEQLRPLATTELRQRAFRRNQDHLSIHAECVKHKKEEESEEDETVEKTAKETATEERKQHDLALGLAVSSYGNKKCRREVRLKGRPIPQQYTDRLLEILETLRWRVPNERSGLSAERYLVLPTNIVNDPYFGALREACHELMQWADPKYYYSGIAVTKNLVASPHIDDRDQSYQYAVSLGHFTCGGELCVEGSGGNEEEWVNVVETHNRIARLDGRHVHWVRTWTGGDRYSLIFYDTSDRHQTPIMESGVDVTFCEQKVSHQEKS